MGHGMQVMQPMQVLSHEMLQQMQQTSEREFTLTASR